MTATTPADLQGRRPRNRRELILAAAGDLFATRGYEHVTLGDIASAVGVGPSALYRHFSGKEELLTEVLLAAMRPLQQILDEHSDDPATCLRLLTASAIDHRRVGVLLQREARQLSEAQRAVVGAASHDLEVTVTRMVASLRPDLSAAGIELVVWAFLATVLSPSFTEIDLPRSTWNGLLSDLANRIGAFDPPEAWDEGPRDSVAGSLTHVSRREAILWRAIELFADRTYASVSIEDVGASLGIAGPSVYAHFDSKHDLLSTAMTRGAAVLEMDVAAAMSSSATPAEALEKLLASYVRFAIEHHRVVSLLVTEIRNVEGDDRSDTMSAQREYVGQWTALLLAASPDLPPIQARFVVLACLMVVNTSVRRSGFRRRPGAHETLVELGRTILGLPAVE